MTKNACFLILGLVAIALPAHADWPSVDQRQRNPFTFSFGSFTNGKELGTSFAPTFSTNCNGDQTVRQELALLEACGMELAVGFEAASHPVDLRFTERYQTFGWTNNFGLGSPHSILGVDALFRYDGFYYGPGVGLGYRSAANGFTFEGKPTQVLSAVVGCDVSRSAFAEARLQTASSEQFRAASLSLGLRF